MKVLLLCLVAVAVGIQGPKKLVKNRPVAPGDPKWSHEHSQDFDGHVKNSDGDTWPSHDEFTKKNQGGSLDQDGDAIEGVNAGQNWGEDMKDDDHKFLDKIDIGELFEGKYCDDEKAVLKITEGCLPAECPKGAAEYCSWMHTKCTSEYCRKQKNKDRVGFGACLKVFKAWDAKEGRATWCENAGLVSIAPSGK